MHSVSTRCLVTVSFAPTTEPTGLPGYIVHVEPASAAAVKPRGFTDQTAAEHFADGLVAGLRACGRSAQVSLDVPGDDDADLLDMGDLDAQARRRAVARAETPEADPVARRLARDAEAGHYRAQALGLG